MCLTLAVSLSSVPDTSTVSSQFEDALAAIGVWREDPGSADIVSRLIKDELPALIRPWLRGLHLEVKGSIGVGSTTDTPWVGIFPADETSAKHGVYLVYLFAADGSRVYLSLIQGTEDVAGGLKPLRKRAIDMRRVTTQPAGTTTDIKLHSKNRGMKYEAVAAYAFPYDAGSVPADDQLQRDLIAMLEPLQVVRAAGLSVGALEPVHLIVKWTPSRGEAVEAHRLIAEEMGSTWWGVMSDKPHVLNASNIANIETQLTDGIETFVYLYGGGTTWQTKLKSITESAEEIDSTLLPSYYTPAGCKLFFELEQFTELPTGWLAENVVLKNYLDAELAPALGNQTSPIQVYKLAGAETPPTPSAGSAPPTPAQPALTLEWLRATALLDPNYLDEILEAVTGASPQIALMGPPGTSKTWIAKALARYITDDRPLAHRIVQFHATYGYEEFIEGLRPIAKDGAIVFERVNGVVLNMAEDAADADEELIALVIDEMNRANLPRVFGELMYLFEYRDEPIELLYTPSFSLPRNLRFIGTMNSADRSIRSIDTALRRRFDIYELPPRRQALEEYYAADGRTNHVTKLLDGFEKLNEQLTEQIDRHHTIGHAFFMAEDMTMARLKHIWERKLAPLIEEYFFDQPDIAETFVFDEYFG